MDGGTANGTYTNSASARGAQPKMPAWLQEDAAAACLTDATAKKAVEFRQDFVGFRELGIDLVRAIIGGLCKRFRAGLGSTGCSSLCL